MEVWRVLITPQLPGALNMAIDQTIANFVNRGESPNTIRFYNWQPFCLSLGYHQNIKDVNLTICREMAVDVVKRPTGGKAVFHANELTYSVIASSDSLVFRKTIPETFYLLADWLLESLSILGVETELAPKLKSKSKQKIFRNPSCFSSTSDYEVTVQGKKLIGSAQRRWPGCLLQHGSFLLGDDYLRVVELLDYSLEIQEKMLLYLKNHTIYFSKLVPNMPSFYHISSIMLEAWKMKFNVKVVIDNLSNAETDRVKKIQGNFDLFTVNGERLYDFSAV